MFHETDKGLTRFDGGLAASAREGVAVRHRESIEQHQLSPDECLIGPISCAMQADLLSNKDSTTDNATCNKIQGNSDAARC